MTLSLSSFSAWQKEACKLQEARQWLAHIGKAGRSTRDHQDILHLSGAHCSTAKFTIAGQYTDGGKNYWESPDAFNDAMKAIVLRHFNDLAAEAMVLLERRTAAALIKAEDEIAAVQTAISDAKLVALDDMRVTSS